MYGNWPGNSGGAFNWKEAGEHYNAKSSSTKESVLKVWNLHDFRPGSILKVVDASGRLTGQVLSADTRSR